MTKEQLDIEIKALKLEYEQKENALYKKYALANLKFKKGDIVRHKAGILKIEKFHMSILWGNSEIYFSGIDLKNDFTMAKKQSGVKLYASNIIEKVIQ